MVNFDTLVFAFDDSYTLIVKSIDQERTKHYQFYINLRE